MNGEVTALVTSMRRSKEFLDFLRWLVEDVYRGKERIYLFLDNCSIHHTKAVGDYIANCKGLLVVIWNATYAPNLNLIERFWGHLKRSAIHNYYFETVENPLCPTTIEQLAGLKAALRLLYSCFCSLSGKC